MSNPAKLTKADVEALYAERQDILNWLNPPPPDPEIWPPVGWYEHPEFPGMFYRLVDGNDLRNEIFGHPFKDEWEQAARDRLATINETLRPLFFPKAKEEGTQRGGKWGFIAMLKRTLTRKFDVKAMPQVVEAAQAIADKKKGNTLQVEDAVIEWKPALDLKAYRELPEKVREAFDQCLIVTPGKEVFEIVREADAPPEDGEETEA